MKKQKIKVEEASKLVSKVLKVPKLKLDFWVSKRCKSDYGMCSYLKDGTIRIKLSEFVVNTPFEQYVIEHEVTHAYVNEYFPEENPHGHNFKEITNKIFQHNLIERPIYIKNVWELFIDADFNTNTFIIEYEGEKKAIIQQINKEDYKVTDSKGKPFKHSNTKQIYLHIFMWYAEVAEEQGFPFRAKMREEENYLQNNPQVA